MYLAAVGEYVDIIGFEHDLTMQTGPQDLTTKQTPYTILSAINCPELAQEAHPCLKMNHEDYEQKLA